MLDLTSLDEMPVTTRIRTRPRRKKIEMLETKRPVRWRMTLDELCYAACISATQFHDWADQGILGKRLTFRPNGGRGSQITREVAQRTVLVARLVAAGVHPLAAGCIAQGHKVNDIAPLHAELTCGVTITILREDLP